MDESQPSQFTFHDPAAEDHTQLDEDDFTFAEPSFDEELELEAELEREAAGPAAALPGDYVPEDMEEEAVTARPPPRAAPLYDAPTVDPVDTPMAVADEELDDEEDATVPEPMRAEEQREVVARFVVDVENGEDGELCLLAPRARAPRCTAGGLLSQPISALRDAVSQQATRRMADAAATSGAGDETQAAVASSSTGAAGADDAPAPLPSRLWVDKYAPRTFMDLLSDERVNRHVLMWLKQWDDLVFGPRVGGGGAAGHAGPTAGSAGHAAARAGADRPTAPERPLLLISGPPGLGKTTLAHIVARHAGYRPVEVNASDERSAKIMKQRVREATETQSVRPHAREAAEHGRAPRGAAHGAAHGAARARRSASMAQRTAQREHGAARAWRSARRSASTACGPVPTCWRMQWPPYPAVQIARRPAPLDGLSVRARAPRQVYGDKRPPLIILDEIDGAMGGAEGSGAINELIKLANATSATPRAGAGEAPSPGGAGGAKTKAKRMGLQRPVICICNDVYAPALRPLRAVAELVEFRSASNSQLAARLRSVCRAEKLSADERTINALCALSNNDVRACLNTMQFVRARSSVLDQEQLSGVGFKSVGKSTFALWKQVFLATAPKASNAPSERGAARRPPGRVAGARAAQDGGGAAPRRETSTSRLYEDLELADVGRVLDGVAENYLSVSYTDPQLSRTADAADALSMHDVMTAATYGKGHFALARYASSTVVAVHVACSVPHLREQLAFPTSEREARTKRQARESMLRGWHGGLSASLQTCASAPQPLCRKPTPSPLPAAT